MSDSPSTPVATASETFLSGGGEMGAQTRAKDWSTTPLGPPSGWPQSLKTAVRIILNSRYPMFVWWGTELSNLYNDGYIPILGERHPEALGRSAPKIWHEIWEDLRLQVESVIHQNEATWNEELPLFLERYGYKEETYFTFSYSPLPDDEGGVGGLFCACTEDTERVVSERRLSLLRQMAGVTAEARTVETACEMAAAIMAEGSRDLSFALIYLLESHGRRARLVARAHMEIGGPAAPEIIEIGDNSANSSLWPFARALEREVVEVTELDSKVEISGGAWPEAVNTASILPLAKGGQQDPIGFLIVGASPRRPFDEGYRRFFELLARGIDSAIASAGAYEEERKRAEALLELDRAKTAFFSNVSHEFRTPLTLMLGPLENALATPEGALTPDGVDLVYRNGQRLLRLVNTLLDFTRIEAGRVQAVYEPIDLPALTADLASLFRSAVEKAGLQLTIDCPPLPDPVFVDREMWEKIVLNLLSNALKYTFDGEVAVSLRAQDGSAVLSVRDTGIGIPEEELPNLFNRFHRVEGARGRTHEGTGIGLALVQELVKLHGGTVDVESSDGRGATFTVAVPLGKEHLPADRIGGLRTLSSTAVGASPFVEEALRWLPDTNGEASAGVVLSDAPARPLGEIEEPPGRVVLADDNADMRQYVRRLLASTYEVIAVADGEEAVRASIQHKPDLVLTDIMMPKLDGFGVLRALRENPRTASIPVLMISARAGEEARVEGLQAGADGYLVKPFSARELMARVSGLLALAKLRRESHQREQELRAETTNVLESIGEGFVALDKDLRFTYANSAAERIFRLNRGELDGKSFPEILPAGRWQELETLYETSSTERGLARFEYRYEPTDRWFEVSVYPAKDDGFAVYFCDITERRQVEQALRESEERFRHMADNAPVMVWVTDPDGTCTYLGQSWYEFTGATPGSGLGFGWLGLLHPEDRDRSEKIFLGANSRREAFRLEYRVRRKDGEYCWAIGAAAPRLAPDGQFLGFIGSVIDISERKQAELALATLAAIVESSDDVIISKSLDGIITSWNASAQRLFGYTAEEAIGKSITLIIPPERLEEEQLILARLRRGERIDHFETVRVARDGRRLDLSITISALRDSSGNVVGASKVARDISKQKEAEAALRESEERFRYLADEAPVLIWMAGLEGCEFANHGYLRFCGCSMQDVLGWGWERFLHPEDAEGYKSAYLRALDRRELFEAQFRFRRNDGEYRWLRTTAAPRLTSGNKLLGYVGVSVDITEIKRSEAALKEADRRKDEFLAMLGHELRNPLAAISSGMSLLQSDTTEDRRAWIEQMMDRQVQQLGRLVDDLLDVTRVTQGKIQLRKERVELNGILESAIVVVEEIVKQRKHEIIVSLPYEPVYLEADPARLEQILVNLLTNAAKYMPRPGRIWLSAETEGNEAVIRCRDEGIGMSPETVESVFEPFVQINPSLDRSESGLGMGLTLVRRLAEMHGGSAVAASRGLGAGSEFTLRLPVAAERQATQKQETTRPANQREAEPVRVLVVDDNRDLAESTAMLLRRAGHDVSVAYDGEAALSTAADEHPQVVLLDLGLPGLDGYEVARRMRSILDAPDTTIVAVSGYNPDNERTGRAGFDAHLVKPVSFDDLLTLIERSHVARDSEAPPLAAKRILLIEDNGDLALLTAEMLRQHGQQVLVAFNGEEAMDKIKEYNPEIVLCDLNLPGRDGFAIAKAIRQQGSPALITLIGVTAADTTAFQKYVEETPFDSFLPKPLEWATLRHILLSLDESRKSAGNWSRTEAPPHAGQEKDPPVVRWPVPDASDS